MQAVNLLPHDAYAPKQRLPYAPIVLAATVPLLAVALVYLGHSIEHSKVTDRQAALAVLQSQVEALKPSPVLASRSSLVAGERSDRESELDAALAKRIPWDVTFDQLARVLPANAWLTHLTALSPTPATSATTAVTSPTALTLQGYTYTEDDVAAVLSRLALVPGLADVALSSAGLTQAGTKELVQFTVTAAVNGAGS
ncbi:MAG TPA: PilN domain-containing protein [Gaiellaceae bacterium]